MAIELTISDELPEKRNKHLDRKGELRKKVEEYLPKLKAGQMLFIPFKPTGLQHIRHLYNEVFKFEQDMLKKEMLEEGTKFEHRMDYDEETGGIKIYRTK